MKYKVRYQDNTGNWNVITEYATEELAEKAIKEELEACEDFYQSLDYYYADFGNKTEFWVLGGDEYASWERLWK